MQCYHLVYEPCPKPACKRARFLNWLCALNDAYSGDMSASDATTDRDQWSRDRCELGLRVAVAFAQS